MKTYTHNGKSFRGVLRDHYYGRPSGTLLLEEVETNAVEKLTEAANSVTAPRGREQVAEVFDALRSHVGVSVAKVSRRDGCSPEETEVTFKSSAPGKISSEASDMSDFLNSLMTPLQGVTSPIKSSAGSRANSGASGHALSQGVSPGKKQWQRVSENSRDVAARSHQLNLSETVVLKAKLLVKDLENDATVMQQGVKKVENTLTSLASRMTDKAMEHYAADYGDHVWET